ncbi:MAG TPA: alpha-L-fucosidase [Saprospiraceae bacterium]|nr:alpha-L-fucosidase [Saprospiraceae bacterium]
MRFLLPIVLALFSSLVIAQKTYTPDWESLDSRPTPDWWLDAKFGIFIHWGVYSVPAFTAKGNYAEWYQNSLENNAHKGKVKQFHEVNYGDKSYYDLADDFHAELFNPDDWARLFERAGAKYVVLTSKHHDGFCLWPNEDANRTWGIPWNAEVRGPGRDLVGELFGALNKTKVKPGLYFSLYEWYNPIWQYDKAQYAREHAMPQLYELIQRYEPWVIWSDGDWDATSELWQTPQFLSWLYSESTVKDKIVANDRWGSDTRFHHGGIYTPEYQPDMDFEDHAWEESRGMGASYGYNRHEDAWDYNSAQSLVLHLVDKVSRGGNFLLDIGPDAHGKIPPIMQDRLLEIGKWLNINGEAIYNTRRWKMSAQWSAGRRDWKPDPAAKGPVDALLKQTVDPDAGFAVKEVFYTWNPETKSVYAIFPKYPNDRKLVLKGVQLPATGSEVTFLATKEKLKAENLAGNLVITLPEYNPNRIKSAHAYAVKISGYGDFVAKPRMEVFYDPETVKPTVKITCTTPGAIIRYTTDGKEPSETSATYSTPLTPASAATIKARAYKAGQLSSNADSMQVKFYKLMPAQNMLREPLSGLRAELKSVEDNKYTSEQVLRGNLEKAEDVSKIELDPACKEGNCGMVWKGLINIPETGGYEFWTASDDGSLLSIDGEIVVNNDGDHGTQEKSGIAHLQKGWHSIRIIYFNSGGDASMKVHYAPLGEAKRSLDPRMLGH